MVFANLNIRTDKVVETQAETTFDELGLSMATAANPFLRTTIREDGIPFRLRLDQPNTTTVVAIAEGCAMLDNPNAPECSSMGALRTVLEV